MFEVTDETYTFLRHNSKENETFVRLNQPLHWAGTIIQFRDVRIEEDDDGENATLGFQYTVVDTPEPQPEILETDENFRNFIGSILHNVIERAVEAQINREKLDGQQDTDDGITESDQ